MLDFTVALQVSAGVGSWQAARIFCSDGTDFGQGPVLDLTSVMAEVISRPTSGVSERATAWDLCMSGLLRRNIQLKSSDGGGEHLGRVISDESRPRLAHYRPPKGSLSLFWIFALAGAVPIIEKTTSTAARSPSS